tara:strand:+ start:260 stop:529 length:270 start_codon:yes stop_codon:yes gene_type:complete
MFIDGINGLTLSNNVLRIQVARTGASGEITTDDLYIPAANVNQFVNAIVEGVKGLNEQLENQTPDNKDEKPKKEKKDKASLADVDEKSN